jgi:hypothetical protein
VTRLSEERQQQLIALACELVNRVRDVDPERNGTWLEAHRADWRDLLIVLAAMVDPTVPLPVALAWTWPLADRDE